VLYTLQIFKKAASQYTLLNKPEYKIIHKIQL